MGPLSNPLLSIEQGDLNLDAEHALTVHGRGPYVSVAVDCVVDGLDDALIDEFRPELMSTKGTICDFAEEAGLVACHEEISVDRDVISVVVPHVTARCGGCFLMFHLMPINQMLGDVAVLAGEISLALLVVMLALGTITWVLVLMILVLETSLEILLDACAHLRRVRRRVR